MYGFNISQVDGDEVVGYHKFGVNAGAMAMIPVVKNFSFTIETIYNQKGSYQSPQYDDSLSYEYKVILNYLEVPVLLQYTDKDVIRFGTGFSWGRLVQFKEWEHGSRVNWANTYGPYKRNDVNFLVDVQFKATKGLYIDFRYAYSAGKIRTRIYKNIYGNTWTRKQFNNMISLRLVYIFKDKPIVKQGKTSGN